MRISPCSMTLEAIAAEQETLAARQAELAEELRKRVRALQLAMPWIDEASEPVVKKKRRRSA